MSKFDQRMAAAYSSSLRFNPKKDEKPKAAAKAAVTGIATPPRFGPESSKQKPVKVPKPTAQALRKILPEDVRKSMGKKFGSGRKLANGFRVYQDLTVDKVKNGLYTYSPAFRLLKRALASDSSFTSWGRSNYPKTFDDMPASARQQLVPKWAIAEVGRYSSAVNALAKDLHDASAARKVHFYDVVDFLSEPGFSGEAKLKGKARAKGKQSMANVAMRINLMKHLRPWLVRSHTPFLVKFGNDLQQHSGAVMTGGVAPYPAFYGSKPWKTGRSSNVMGVEVTKIGYAIATDVNDEGKVTASTNMEHALASTIAWDKSGGDAATFKAILARTPVGRAFLCQDPSTKNLFLASDHAPRSKMWATQDDNPFLMKLYGFYNSSYAANKQPKRLNLFVF